MFVNCEAQSIYPYRSLLEEEQFKTCFNEYRDLMAAARVGRDRYVRQIAGYNTGEDDTSARYVPGAIFEIMWGTAINRSAEEEEPLTRARMSMCRVCVSITSDKTIFPGRQESAEKLLHVCLGSVSVFKLT